MAERRSQQTQHNSSARTMPIISVRPMADLLANPGRQVNEVRLDRRSLLSPYYNQFLIQREKWANHAKQRRWLKMQHLLRNRKDAIFGSYGLSAADCWPLTPLRDEDVQQPKVEDVQQPKVERMSCNLRFLQPKVDDVLQLKDEQDEELKSGWEQC
ncbi:Hypothetical predicted protein [Cloeon dipterum]|uniref:Uncharacterized protein n=1 Tax=Cloeon dipterum TaxID=197152 RepID=A0A8S1CHM3_9INSE|nr:Hypothetical predicted protein [Cloeon dipterum]